MLVSGTCSERTETEFNTMLQTARFSKARVFNILTTPLFVIESARTKDLVFRFDQTSESKQEASIEELEVRKVDSTSIPRNELALDQIKQIKAKSIDVILKLMEHQKYEEVTRLAQAIHCEKWHEVMQAISSIAGRDPTL